MPACYCDDGGGGGAEAISLFLEERLVVWDVSLLPVLFIAFLSFSLSLLLFVTPCMSSDFES